MKILNTVYLTQYSMGKLVTPTKRGKSFKIR